MKLGKVLIVDGSYLIHRALHVKQLYELKNSEGLGTGGIFQFLRSLYYETNKLKEYYPIVTWDNGQSLRRLSIYPNYKHHSDRVMEIEEAKKLGLSHSLDEESEQYLTQYHEQRDNLIEILSALGIPSLRFRSWEGDDLMYILAKLSEDSIVMTDDKDLIQLLSPKTRILRPMRKEMLDYESYQKVHNDPNMRKFIIEKSIVGDPSDNIPKCLKGVGGVTAGIIAKAIVEEGENWKESLKDFNRKVIREFISSEEVQNQLKINIELIDLSKVDSECTTDFLYSVKASLLEGLKRPNFISASVLLKKYDIELDINKMIYLLTELQSKSKIIY